MHGLKIDQNPFIWNAKNDINSVYFNASYYLMQSFGVQLGARFENQDKNFTIDFEELTCNQDVCIAFNEFLTFLKSIIQHFSKNIKKRTGPIFLCKKIRCFQIRYQND